MNNNTMNTMDDAPDADHAAPATCGGMDFSWVLDYSDEHFPVNARWLLGALGSGQKFGDWIKNRIAVGRLEENTDYVLLPTCGEQDSWGGSKRVDYHLTADTAMQLCQMEMTSKGTEVRMFFIARHKRLTASGELVARKQVVLVGRLDVEMDGKIHRMVYVVGIEAEQVARIKRMGAAVKRDMPSHMLRLDPGPAVYTGILRDMTPQEFALDVTCAPKDSPVIHLKKDGLDLAGMPVIDGDPDKYRVPLSNSYLLVDCDGSFCFEFAIGALGTFFTEHCTVEQIEGWMRGRLLGAPMKTADTTWRNVPRRRIWRSPKRFLRQSRKTPTKPVA